MSVGIPRLSRALMRKSLRLLDMEYRPSEAGEELGASKEQIMRLIYAGAPARKDSAGRYWIHGPKFVKWLEEIAPKRAGDKTIFSEDEAYCVICRKMVHFTETRRIKRLVYGKCPEGHKTTRFVSARSQGKARKNHGSKSE
jgi:hypothetical protein